MLTYNQIEQYIIHPENSVIPLETIKMLMETTNELRNAVVAVLEVGHEEFLGLDFVIPNGSVIVGSNSTTDIGVNQTTVTEDFRRDSVFNVIHTIFIPVKPSIGDKFIFKYDRYNQEYRIQHYKSMDDFVVTEVGRFIKFDGSCIETYEFRMIMVPIGEPVQENEEDSMVHDPLDEQITKFSESIDVHIEKLQCERKILQEIRNLQDSVRALESLGLVVKISIDA